MRKKTLLGFVIACGIGGFLFYSFFGKGLEQHASLMSTPVFRGSIEDVVSATGIVNPRDYVDVGAQVSGQLRVLHVKVGDEVKKGDLLAEIDTTVYKAKVDASRAQLRYQRAQLGAKESDLSLAKIAYERQKNLHAKDATSLESLQSAHAQFQSAHASIEMIHAQIEQIESSLRADEANLEYARIYAPMAGTVVSITARQGQTLNANQQAPIILRIADLSTMTIRAEVSEADVTKLRKGMDVYFKTLGSEFRWESKLDKVEPTPTVTNNVVLYSALFDSANKDGRLMSYMTTQVFFIKAHAKEALLIPMSALHVKAKEGKSDEKKSEKKARVSVVGDDGVVREREIRIGVSNRVHAQVLSGLEEGEKVLYVKASTKSPEGKKPASSLEPKGR